MMIQGNKKFVKILDEILNEYLTRFHRTIKMRPVDVTKKDEKRLQIRYNEVINCEEKPKFKIGDKVRLSVEKLLFEKSSISQNYTCEVFTISKILNTNPITYLVQDENGKKIKGTIYAQEMIKTKFPDVFLIEKIIRKQGNKIYVKFLGFDKKYNQWINNKDIVS